MMTMTQTPETTPAIAAARANFDRLTKSSYTNSMTSGWGYLYFTETGKQRMTHTIGFLEAIHVFEPMRAYELADDLCKYLDYLSRYAGTIESPEGRTSGPDKKPIEFPAYRVCLGDDGGIGSFSIAWYRAIPHTAMMAAAELLADDIAMAKHEKKFEALSREESYPVWEEALRQASEKLKLRKELELDRCYRHSWDTENNQMMGREWMCYGYCHNGGLIFHHDQKDITRGNWSTHT